MRIRSTNTVCDSCCSGCRSRLIGFVQLRLGHTIFGEVGFSLCGTDRRALLVHVEVEEKHRRRGAGRVLVAAAVVRAPRCEWTMFPIGEDPVAVAFWASVGAVDR
ncbi:GNAT family N-acetyltransferase [Amycolatopsis regifaucium]|uniref:GNAT family N-acetyltransferase n=1 Tax=Amycolatopsis regifaucium TaxID=546365 RepID=UPI0011605CCF